MTWIKLFAPSLVLGLWSALWALGVRGDFVVTAGLVATAGALVLSEMENRR